MKKNTDLLNMTLKLLVKTASLSPNGILWLNQEGHILAVNEALASQLGYDFLKFEPRTVFEVNPSTSLLSWKRLWKRLIEESQITIDTEQITADDAIFPVTMRMMLLEAEGQVICMALNETTPQKGGGENNRFEDLLNMTAQVAGVGAYELDLVTNELIITDEFFRLLDIPKTQDIKIEETRAVFRNRIAKEDLPQYIKNHERATASGESTEQELSYLIRGKYEAFNYRITPVHVDGQTVKIYATIQNVAKVAKRTDEMYFTKFCLDHARDMILWINERDQKIAYVNNKLCKTLGYASSELLGKHFSILINQDIQAVSWNDFDEQIVEKGEVDLDVNFITKKGKVISVSTSTNRLNFRGKNINCTFARNLSQKKKRNELLTMVKHSLDQSIDVIYWLREDATFRYFNSAFVKKSGYTRKELEKMTILDFFPDSTMEDFKKEWEKLQAGKPIQRQGQKMVLKNEKSIVTEVMINLVEVDGKEYSTTILRDITERKQKENELQEYLKEIEKLKATAEAENIMLKEEIELESDFSNIITRDPNYKKVMRQIEQVADTDATVLILGETGTGKELLARAVHQLSDRADYQMIKVNCGALPENLIESELFGHEKGAFTGAYQQKIGKFERAEKGTIFLDEIGELPLDLQTQLLRVLQEGEIERVGGLKTITLDVRVIAATNRNLEEQVASGKFREDLYYRLNVFPIYNIPLRERREDIKILVKHFTDKYSKKLNKEITEISPAGMNKLLSYNFPGNVRELENIIERSVILSKGKVLNIDASLTKRRKTGSGSTKFNTMEEMQKEHIIEALRRCKGKVSGQDGAAALLRMNDKTLTSRMKKLSIDKRDYLNN